LSVIGLIICLNTVLCVYCLDRQGLHNITAGTVDRLASPMDDRTPHCHTSSGLIGAAGIPLWPVYKAGSNEQRHEFKTRRWLRPNGLNPTTEHTVTTPHGQPTQPPLVTSTSASCPLRDSGPPRPRSRVEDTNGSPARRCSCKLLLTRRVGGESPMA
jgi:hypothetical protein